MHKNRVEYKVEFHGYQDLAFPTKHRPDNQPYCPLWLAVKDPALSKYQIRYKALEADFNEYWGRWNSHPLKDAINAFFMKVPLPHKIEQIVCFDLGSFSQRGGPQSFEQSVHKSFLHIAIRIVAGIIRKRQRHPVRVLVQDPNYTKNEERILAKNDYVVVGRYGAKGFTLIDEKTMVFSPCPNTCVKEIVAEIAKPAAVFWSPVVPSEVRQRERSTPHELPDNIKGYWMYVTPSYFPILTFHSFRILTKCA
ncbi:hypothetical protein F5B20DRAFT_540432 [Whalleya microplaca]|nr:hypothetical protein F5B20DRAFT_540432 [Whalleya microplaca]